VESIKGTGNIQTASGHVSSSARQSSRNSTPLPLSVSHIATAAAAAAAAVVTRAGVLT